MSPNTILDVSGQDKSRHVSGIENAPQALEGGNGSNSDEDPGSNSESLGLLVNLFS